MEERKNNQKPAENSSLEKTNSRKAPPKKRKRRKKKSPFKVLLTTLLYILSILSISVILSYLAIYASNDVFAFLKEDRDITIEIPENASISEVSDILSEEGVIEYGFLFNMFVTISANDSVFVEGEHDVNSNMDYRGILNELQKQTLQSSVDVVKVTIPEGYTLEQIAETLEENNVVSSEDFIKAATEETFTYDFLEEQDNVKYQLEGYLFPDTYEFYEGDNAVNVITKMLNNFENKIAGDVTDLAEELGISIHDVVTIASLIEREAQKTDEQAKISGVIHNRLESDSFPYLQIDATIQYIVGHREELLQSDLEIDDLYNTYTTQGLPPGPIANPGYSSLLAAVAPEEHNYYFYVAKPDGYHIFTTTLDEHNAAIQTAKNMEE